MFENARFGGSYEWNNTVVEFLMKNGEKYEIESGFGIEKTRAKVRQSMAMTLEFLEFTDKESRRTLYIRKSEIAGIFFIKT